MYIVHIHIYVIVMLPQSKEKMMRNARRGCVRLKGAIIGIDDEDDTLFTITVDGKTFHLQARDGDERDGWIRALENAISLLTHNSHRIKVRTPSPLSPLSSCLYRDVIWEIESLYRIRIQCNIIRRSKSNIFIMLPKLIKKIWKFSSSFRLTPSSALPQSWGRRKPLGRLLENFHILFINFDSMRERLLLLLITMSLKTMLKTIQQCNIAEIYGGLAP